MAISGSGTQGDPYIAHDWDEFAWAAVQNNIYLELANDIQAPSSNVNLEINAYQIDGNGFAINGVFCSAGSCFIAQCYNHSIIIKNLAFTNIIMEGGNIFLQHARGYWKALTLNNTIFSGYFQSGKLFTDAGGPNYDPIYINGMALNLEIYTPNFQIVGLENQSHISYGTISDINAKIKYVGCSPSAKLFVTDNGQKTVRDSLFNITIPSTGAKLDIGATLNNCCVIGSGSGIIVTSASGVNVVEDTIPVDTSLENVHSVTTTQMKNAQYLHDLGFPIGVD